MIDGSASAHVLFRHEWLRKGVLPALIVVVTLLTLSAAQAPALAASSLSWSNSGTINDQAPHEEMANLAGVSCPTTSFCGAVDSLGNFLSSTNPTGGAAAWTTTNLWRVNFSNGLRGISCPSTTMCIVIDGAGGLWSSTNPTGGKAAWSRFYVEGVFSFSSVECPTTSLCVATSGDKVVTSTDPTGGEGAWATADVPAGPLSCPSATFCAATSFGGKVYTTTNPTGGAGAWQETSLSGSPDLTGIECPSAGLCIAGYGSGVYTSTDPTGGAGTWTSAIVGGIWRLTCPTASLCVGAAGGEVVTSTNPTGGVGHWSRATFEATPGFFTSSVSCPSISLCVAVGKGKSLTSTNPTGGAGAWSAQQIDSDGFSRLTTADCPSASFCAVVDAAGKVLTSTNPTGGPGAWGVSHVRSPLKGLSCPSSGLCVGAGFQGISFSTNPASHPGTWQSVDLGGLAGEFQGIDCPSAALCVAVNYWGDIYTSTNPTGDAGAWTRIAGVDPDATGWGSTGDTAVSCASVSLCAVVGTSGNVLTSTNPAGGAGAWSVTQVGPDPTGSPPSGALTAISCPSASLCATVAPYPTFAVFTATNPLGGAAAWSSTALTDIGPASIACPSDDLCVTGGYSGFSGSTVAVSTNPTGGAAAWKGAEISSPESVVGLPAMAVACASESLCFVGDGSGNLFLGTPSGEPDQHEISVFKEGTGSGVVTSSPAGISCGSSCKAGFEEGETITLTATPDAGSYFAGWTASSLSSAPTFVNCDGGTEPCTVTLNDDVEITGFFYANSDKEQPPTDSGSTPPPAGAPSGSTSAPQIAPKKSPAGKRVPKRCKKLQGKAKRKCVRKAQSKPGKRKRTRAGRVTLAADLAQSCAAAGVAKPRIVEAWVRHPGDRKTQSMFVEADWRALPGDCDGQFARVPSVRFQLQSPKNHARWINVGGFVAPERRSWEVKEELEAEREAEGKSCWEMTEAGKTFACDLSFRVTGKGGVGTAYAPESPGWPEPDPALERYRYNCTPGPGVTQVRALVKNAVKDLSSGEVAAQRIYEVPVKVKSYSRPPQPGHPKRAALQGPC